MIIFDLDGTLADCEHRMHFVDAKKNKNYKRRMDATLDECINNSYIAEEYIHVNATRKDILDDNYLKWKPDWDSFYEACDEDKPIIPVIQIFNIFRKLYYTKIWTGRSESVRDKTIDWFMKKCPIGPSSWDKGDWSNAIKMRPIGDYTPDYILKEKWLDELLSQREKIDYVFEDRIQCIEMWRRRGIFVFNCNQGN